MDNNENVVYKDRIRDRLICIWWMRIVECL